MAIEQQHCELLGGNCTNENPLKCGYCDVASEKLRDLLVEKTKDKAEIHVHTTGRHTMEAYSKSHARRNNLRIYKGEIIEPSLWDRITGLFIS